MGVEMMKQGINFHLAVALDGVQLDDCEKVEFAFARGERQKPAKLEQWPGKVERKPGEDVLLVPFTAAETRAFIGPVYMDTRITLRSSTDQPETPIIRLDMDPTIFEEGGA